VATYPFDGRTWDEVFAAADHRLYDSKESGRNRVTGPPPRSQAFPVSA
jgi:PleD family two-component response regulator